MKQNDGHCVMDVPPRVKNGIEGFEYFASLYDTLKECGDNVRINFATCKDFDGNLCAIMGAIFDRLTEEGVSIELARPDDENVRLSLGRNRFFDAWKLPTGIKDKEFFVEYRSFTTSATESFKEYISQELMQKRRFPIHTPKVEERLITSIFEVYDNCLMHGDTKRVVCCGEYDAATCMLHLTIVDCGRTIARNVNAFHSANGIPGLSPCDAIVWAFGEGNTTKANTGGLGLWELRNFIDLNNGSLEVMSGNGMVMIHRGTVLRHELEGCFPGTVVNLNFNFSDTNLYYTDNESPDFDINDIL